MFPLQSTSPSHCLRRVRKIHAARPCGMKRITLFLILGCCTALRFALAQTADQAGEVRVGASKADAIKVLGWPNGQSKAGAREILTYAQGQLILEDGRVTRVDFSPKVPWQAPKAAPTPAAATSTRSVQAVQAWATDYAVALNDAARLPRPVLALFTGPKTPAGTPRIFEEVAAHPEFVDALRGDFVLLRVEFGTQSALQERCEITQYPTAVFLNPTGEILGRLETFPAPAATSRGRTVAAIRDAWVASGGGLAVGSSSGESSAGATRLPTAPMGMASWIAYAWTLIISGVGAGIAIMLLLFWLLWRKWSVPQPVLPDVSRRISDAASGLPTLKEIRHWSQKKVYAVASGLAETEGYQVDTYKLGDNADLELRLPGETRPHALVLALGASEGKVAAHRLRALVKEMESFHAKEGWVLAPAGFGPDAIDYGVKHNLMLMSPEIIMERLRDVPPLNLPGVLGQAAAGR